MITQGLLAPEGRDVEETISRINLIIAFIDPVRAVPRELESLLEALLIKIEEEPGSKHTHVYHELVSKKNRPSICSTSIHGGSR